MSIAIISAGMMIALAIVFAADRIAQGLISSGRNRADANNKVLPNG